MSKNIVVKPAGMLLMNITMQNMTIGDTEFRSADCVDKRLRTWEVYKQFELIGKVVENVYGKPLQRYYDNNASSVLHFIMFESEKLLITTLAENTAEWISQFARAHEQCGLDPVIQPYELPYGDLSHLSEDEQDIIVAGTGHE